MTMRVGIDGEALRLPLSGVGQYVHHLCVELEQLWPQAEFFAYARLPAERLALPSPRWTLRREPNEALRKLPSFLWLKTRGAALCREDRLDVFWAGRTLLPHLPRSVRVVSTVHDLNHVLVPETMEWPTLLSHRLWWRGDLQRADALLANSRGTARRLRELFDANAHDVVPPGLEARFRPVSDALESEALRMLGIEPPYLLSVATLEPRKNVRTLLQAYLALRRAGELPAHRLVLAGARGWRDEKLEAELRAAQSEGVQVAGYIADALMPALYAGADALICASLYEGFGMPVLEARACGARVVVSDVPELREAGGMQAVVVEPTVDGVREGIRRVLRRPRPDEPDLAQRHSWRRSALRLAAALQPGAVPVLDDALMEPHR
ncbi:MAG TPA: glycosyltransferase family 1 protein [Burkholderiaceae bacterium]|jgi:glycosyltransferase involved in cell wall biosynthesis|nr:glycosyltransferase family 1 protein [Burkholderiaceae bacterium]